MNNINEYFQSLFRKKNESITALILPEDMIPGSLPETEAYNIFKNYVSKLESSINKTYGSEFKKTFKDDGKTKRASFKNSNTTIDYNFHPLATIMILDTKEEKKENPANKNTNRTLYFGELKIKEENIYFQNASKFMNDLLNEWLIAYNSKKNEFQIFHSIGDNAIQQGKPLMELLDLHPKKGAEYIKVTGAIGWLKIDI